MQRMLVQRCLLVRALCRDGAGAESWAPLMGGYGQMGAWWRAPAHRGLSQAKTLHRRRPAVYKAAGRWNLSPESAGGEYTAHVVMASNHPGTVEQSSQLRP